MHNRTANRTRELLERHGDEGELVGTFSTEEEDTVRREQAMASRGLRFLGTGVSGGEEGALTAPASCPAARPRPTGWSSGS